VLDDQPPRKAFHGRHHRYQLIGAIVSIVSDAVTDDFHALRR
jgi:hypothetical protein